MPVRDLMNAVSLLAIVLLVAFVGAAVGSEYYLFSIGRRIGISRDLPEPPTHPLGVALCLAIPAGVFFLSRRYAAIFLTVPLILAVLGLASGAMFFEWTPGVAHYLLILSLAALVTFVWTHEDFHQD